MIAWSPFEDATADMPVLCPLCGGYGQQKCMNCLGEGVVPPVKGKLVIGGGCIALLRLL